MVTVKVTRRFRDKYTGEWYNKGDLLTISEGRYNEIKAVGQLVYKIAGNGPVTVADDATKNSTASTKERKEAAKAAPSDGFDRMSIRELKEYADKTYKLAFGTGVKKAEIIDILRRTEQGGK